ncbi:hypothetical protein CPB84DRAFT_1744233 [Gymnopilus junonius]|uniref:Uncharacterized protein n=1 Tax=Gymnopilus junonius TaxID=109634 RepID=A0A9P5NYZ2_GYMJU|nr:hypothetical protein CPB84DRAFT_1744233 [Gymnopilus junonius]
MPKFIVQSAKNFKVLVYADKIRPFRAKIHDPVVRIKMGSGPLSLSQLYCFDIIPATLFLCTLQNAPMASVGGQLGLEVHLKTLLSSKYFAKYDTSLLKHRKCARKAGEEKKKAIDGELARCDEDKASTGHDSMSVISRQ